MKQNLVAKLTDFTNKLKNNEEDYMKKYKELVGDDIKYDTGHNNFNQPDSKSNLNNKNDNFLKLDNSHDILHKRDNEINNLMSSISELASIFKDFQTLVLEQGTILDRIDYNIENALTNTKQAHTNLIQANKNMESNCARNANIILLSTIFILSVLLIFKFFK